MKLESIELDGSLYELTPRGTPAFPIEMYDNVISEFALRCVPWHWHDEVELVYILQGETTVETGSFSETLRAGSGAFFNGGRLHAMHPQGPVPCRTLNIVFSPEIIAGVPYSVFSSRFVQPLLHDGPDLLLLRPEQDGAILSALLEVFGIYSAREEGYELLVRNHLSDIWLALRRRCGGTAVPPTGAENSRLKVLLSYIAQHYQEPITLEELAASAGVSTRTCCRCFRRAAGMTPFQYLMEFRVKSAAQRLAQSDESVTEICFAVGFNDTSYFCKVFRQYVGCTPTAFRRRASGQINASQAIGGAVSRAM